eukprot:50646-Prymnesium_polylepis.1
MRVYPAGAMSRVLVCDLLKTKNTCEIVQLGARTRLVADRGRAVRHEPTRPHRGKNSTGRRGERRCVGTYA